MCGCSSSRLARRAETQQVSHCCGDHQRLVGGDHAYGDAARCGGNHRRIGTIAPCVELDAEEVESVADAPADGRRASPATSPPARPLGDCSCGGSSTCPVAMS